MFQGLSGVENVYTQHTPLIIETLDKLTRGTLRDEVYPYLGNPQTSKRPQEVIVFIVGGVTYEESLAVHNYNKDNPNCKVLIGGTCIHNTTTYLQEIEQAVKDLTNRHARNLHNLFERSNYL